MNVVHEKILVPVDGLNIELKAPTSGRVAYLKSELIVKIGGREYGVRECNSVLEYAQAGIDLEHYVRRKMRAEIMALLEQEIFG